VDRSTGPLDDAAVVRPEGLDRSLVLTIDVITPIVDDPRAFGGIAAANALSDVYAMGGQPQVALSFAGFPTDRLPLEVLHEVLAGAQATCASARCAVVGGHTVSDAEPKFGLAVVGVVDPERVWSQRRARPGDILVLTKRIGTGIVGQAIRAEQASDELILRATAQMLQLNDRARDVGLAMGARSCTDVTGFGLLGHLRNLVEAAGVSATLAASQVPLLDGVLALIAAGLVPGGTRRNASYAAAITTFDEAIPAELRLALADAQTSGGLLLCVPPEHASETVTRLGDAGCEGAAIVGELASPTEGPAIRVTA
jgi:selenide,water dikinase